MTNFSSPGLSATLSERGTIKHNSVLEFVTSINYPPLAEVASKKPEVEKYAHYILILTHLLTRHRERLEGVRRSRKCLWIASLESVLSGAEMPILQKRRVNRFHHSRNWFYFPLFSNNVFIIVSNAYFLVKTINRAF